MARVVTTYCDHCDEPIVDVTWFAIQPQLREAAGLPTPKVADLHDGCVLSFMVGYLDFEEKALVDPEVQAALQDGDIQALTRRAQELTEEESNDGI
jgi:hypothetical protein